MKKIIYFFSLVFILLAAPACELDYTNPNAATEDQVLNTKDGLFALGIGIQQLFSTSGYNSALLTPSVTTRETAIMTTFANLEELENGGTALSGENGYTSRLFARMMRVKGMAESLIDAVPNADLAAGTASGLMAWGHLFRAMTLGIMANNFEQVAIQNSLNNDAPFSDRIQAYRTAIDLLISAIDLIDKTPTSDEYNSTLGQDIDLENTLNAYLARYQLFVGNYNEAISAANKVDQSSTSVFNYDSQNGNPVYEGMFVGTVSYAPRTDFGLPLSLPVDPGDQRVGFYFNIISGSSLNSLPVEEIAAPFFNSLTSAIPVYRPGEMLAIIAEANARLDNLTDAETALNALRQKLPEDDPLGLGAGLTDTYTANGDKAALLNEIYKHRRIECFLCGTSLEDSRRFDRQQPANGTDLTTERNRNFYPYPAEERLNNPNTPNDPTI